MEVAFRRPDRDEVVLVGEPGSLGQEPVLVIGVLTLIGGEVEEAEVDGPVGELAK